MPKVESALYEPLQDGSARCTVCERRCVIPEGGYGYCYTRKNEEGRVYSTTYGEVSTIQVAPIEAKPVFHFYPGSKWLSCAEHMVMPVSRQKCSGRAMRSMSCSLRPGGRSTAHRGSRALMSSTVRSGVVTET